MQRMTISIQMASAWTPTGMLQTLTLSKNPMPPNLATFLLENPGNSHLDWMPTSQTITSHMEHMIQTLQALAQ